MLENHFDHFHVLVWGCQWILCALCWPWWPWLISHMLLGDINKLILRNGKSPCEGHLQVYHKGEWRYVGDKNWNRSTEEVVCRSTNCGTPVSSKESFRPSDSKVWLNDLKCIGNESHLWDCENPGWGKSNFQKDTTRKVQCSSEAWLSFYRY